MDSIPFWQDESPLYLQFSPLVPNALSSKCWYSNGLLNDVTLTIFWVINMTQAAKLQQNFKMVDMKDTYIHIYNAFINIYCTLAPSLHRESTNSLIRLVVNVALFENITLARCLSHFLLNSQ